MRYFFDLDGARGRQDRCGAEYVSDAAARQEATFRAASADDFYELRKYDEAEFIRVRDETDRVICTVAIQRPRR